MSPELDGLPETIPVASELVLWRVFGLSDVYEDRPAPAWRVTERRGPRTSDSFEIIIGDLPADLIDALRQWRAQGSTLLDSRVGRSFTYAEIDDRFRAELVDDVPAEFADPYPLWFTMRLGRQVSLRGVAGVDALWLADPSEMTIVETFETEGNRFLDAATAPILAASAPLNLAQSRYSDRRAFCSSRRRGCVQDTTFCAHDKGHRH